MNLGSFLKARSDRSVKHMSAPIAMLAVEKQKGKKQMACFVWSIIAFGRTRSPCDLRGVV